MENIDLTDFEFNFDAKMFIIDKGLSDQLCDQLIDYAENKKFGDNQVNKLGKEWKDLSIRNDKSLLVENDFITGILYNVAKVNLPNNIPTALNNKIRMSKFEEDTFCAPHQDFQITIGDTISKYTMLVYLNDTNGEGVTRFFSHKSMKYRDITPGKGRVVIFDQRIPHCALDITGNNVKYTIRTDLMYNNVKPFTANPGEFSTFKSHTISRDLFSGKPLTANFKDVKPLEYTTMTTNTNIVGALSILD